MIKSPCFYHHPGGKPASPPAGTRPEIKAMALTGTGDDSGDSYPWLRINPLT